MMSSHKYKQFIIYRKISERPSLTPETYLVNTKMCNYRTPNSCSNHVTQTWDDHENTDHFSTYTGKSDVSFIRLKQESYWW